MNKLFIGLSFIVFTITSCIKGVLDKEPLNLISDKALFRDQDLINAYVAQVYASTEILTNESIGNTPNAAGVTWFQPYTINIISDESRQNWNAYGENYKFGNLRIGGGLLEWWERSYRVINATNVFLEEIESAPVSADFSKKRKAEIRFLRAFNYFGMVKRYGGVPLILKVQSASDPQEELFPARNKEKEVYDFIISEMDAILPDLLPANTSVDYGRPTKAAGLALKCRAALYAGSIAKYGTVQLGGLVGIEASQANHYYDLAYKAANDIITDNKHSLYDKHADKVTNFRNLFIEKMNTEVIMARRFDFTDGNKGGNGWSYDFVQCPLPNAWGHGNSSGPYLELAESFEYVDGTPGTLNRQAIQQGLWTVQDLWRNKDPRFFATIYTHGTPWKGGTLDWHVGVKKPDGTIVTTGSFNGFQANGTQRPDATGFGVLKYLDESKDNFGQIGTSGTDYQVFRFGEVLLNLAEAAFELNKADEALVAINKIRKRAGIAERTSITLSQIRHERQVELAFEGHRYWDLRRWRQAVTALTKDYCGIRYILDAETGKYQIMVINAIHGTITRPKFFEYNYYLPITLARTAQNPSLFENPGYF